MLLLYQLQMYVLFFSNAKVRPFYYVGMKQMLHFCYGACGKHIGMLTLQAVNGN